MPCQGFPTLAFVFIVWDTILTSNPAGRLYELYLQLLIIPSNEAELALLTSFSSTTGHTLVQLSSISLRIDPPWNRTEKLFCLGHSRPLQCSLPGLRKTNRWILGPSVTGTSLACQQVLSLASASDYHAFDKYYEVIFLCQTLSEVWKQWNQSMINSFQGESDLFIF